MWCVCVCVCVVFMGVCVRVRVVCGVWCLGGNVCVRGCDVWREGVRVVCAYESVCYYFC